MTPNIRSTGFYREDLRTESGKETGAPQKKHTTSHDDNKDQEKRGDDVPKGKNFDGFA